MGNAHQHHYRFSNPNIWSDRVHNNIILLNASPIAFGTLCDSLSEETSTTEIGITYKTSIEGSTSQVDAAQVFPIQLSYRNFSEGEISSPSSIETQDVLFSRSSTVGKTEII